MKKHRWHAWHLNPGRQYGRRRRIHWVMVVYLIILNGSMSMLIVYCRHVHVNDLRKFVSKTCREQSKGRSLQPWLVQRAIGQVSCHTKHRYQCNRGELINKLLCWYMVLTTKGALDPLLVDFYANLLNYLYIFNELNWKSSIECEIK